jgi:RNA polymerase sigma-70 factor (ECF subfamily)
MAIVDSDGNRGAGVRQRELYDAAVSEFGSALNRLSASYEFDPERRRDLKQEIHFQLWRSLAVFDDRCSLKTWTFRVAHNVAVSYVNRERRTGAPLIGLEEIEQLPATPEPSVEVDRTRALERLWHLISALKPLDRQIMLCYLEDMDCASIAEITGLSTGNVAMKIHRIKAALARRFAEEQHHV